jgi:kynurenine 3-monooxygenase
MINKAEDFENVQFFFEHKVCKVDLRNRTLYVQRFVFHSFIYLLVCVFFKLYNFRLDDPNEELIPIHGDLLLACDGAFSAVRRSLMAYPRFDYTQEYIQHGYFEFNIQPKNDRFAMEKNVFHIWPRGDFTLIALANTDKTFTVTLFAPFELFEKELYDSRTQVQFFQRHFSDALNLLGEQHVIEVFERVGRPSALVSLKCNPHGFESFLILMGDAARKFICVKIV